MFLIVFGALRTCTIRGIREEEQSRDIIHVKREELFENGACMEVKRRTNYE